MTPEAQRIALAKWDGWKFHYQRDIENFYGLRFDWPWKHKSPNWTNVNGFWATVPDYLRDLNAVAELEDKLARDTCLGDAYHGQLIDVVARDNDPLPASQCRGIHRATAAQRCEALLKTIGLWKP